MKKKPEEVPLSLFTPGPWSVDERALRGWEFRITAPMLGDPRSNMVMTIADVPNATNVLEYDAVVRGNAQLIAAAPEMFEVLKTIANCHSRHIIAANEEGTHDPLCAPCLAIKAISAVVGVRKT